MTRRAPARDVDRYFTPEAVDGLRQAIAEASGLEVFFLGRAGEDGRVAEVKAWCRGHATAVPALLDLPRSGESVIHNHPSGRLVPSDADLALASRYGQDGVAFFIVDNAVTRTYCVVEPRVARRVPVDPARLAEDLGPGGRLAARLTGYEARPTQVAMAGDVAAALDRGGIAVVEAGTGTGKSLAYLVPAAVHALANRERVAVSTRTINLQQQLLSHDLPVVQALVPELKAALVKGRGNYLCRRKLEDRLRDLELFEGEDRRFLEQVAAWAETTPDGSLSDLPFVPDPDLWEEVRSSSEETLRVRCPHYDRCFYYESRRRAAEAHVLVVNHALLLADLRIKDEAGSTGAGVLPRFHALVLDEAHHLEDAATSQAATRVQSSSALRPLSRLRPARERRPGTLGRLRRALEEATSGAGAGGAALRLLDGTVVPGLDALRARLPLWFEDLAAAAAAAVDAADLERSGEARLRLRDGEPLPPVLAEVLPDRVAEAAAALTGLASDVERLRAALLDLPDDARQRCVQSAMELASAATRLVAVAQGLTAVVEPHPNRCRWVEVYRPRARGPAERGRGGLQVRLCASPIDVADLVRDTVLGGVRAAVLTSATLTVDRSFRHFRERVGLASARDPDGRVSESRYDSPFDHRRQVLLGVPDDVPEPGRPGYPEAVTDLVCRAVEASRGRAFVLFTSYGLLSRVARAAEERLGPGYRVLRQGDLERSRLLDSFRAGGRAVLFGTDSFWEGVDVRGEALSLVVLTRLPFRVPTEPVQQARAEAIEREGGDAFRDYAVPQAVIRLKQGFGRLIRSRTDRGAVLILDPRVVSRPYGRAFLRSLPDVEPRVAPGLRLVDEVARFLDSPPPGAPGA